LTIDNGQVKNVSEFLLDAGIAAANETLTEQCQFYLTSEQWTAFQAALDRPPKDIPQAKQT
jgi:uncharacterized protein (DUF1778 family)